MSHLVGYHRVSSATQDLELGREALIAAGVPESRIYEEKGRLATEIASVPLGRMGQVSDIANAIVYLAGPGGDYITGTDLVVDGGRDRKRVVVSQNAPAVA